MRLIGCDRCGATFPLAAKRTEIQLTELTGDCDAGEPTWKELCPVCRRDLDEFLSGTGEIPHRTENKPEPVASAEPPTKVDGRANRKLPTTRECEICGRVGHLRYVETPTGWKCSPTAVKCSGHQTEPNLNLVNGSRKSAVVPDAPPAVAETPVAKPVLTPGVTAHCQDCTRTWTLTGVPLALAVEQHELNHCHIVTITEGATA